MLLKYKQAWAYLGISRRTFFRLLPCIPRVDMRPPGSGRAVWRVDQADIDALILARKQTAPDSTP